MTRTKSLLLVDDEPHVCRSLRRALRHTNYTIHTAHSADEGMSILAEHEVDVILSDQRMPGRQGTEFLSEVMRRHPATVRMILSGAAEISDITEAMEAGAIYKFLTKPIDPALLRANIYEAFSRAESMRPARGSTDSADGLEMSSGPMSRAELERLYPSIMRDADAAGRKLCLVMVHMNQYHNVIGSFGHAFGEQYLRAIEQRLGTEFSAYHWLCSTSPGAYAILTADEDPQARILTVRARVEALFSEPVFIDSNKIRISTSLGATVSQNPNATLEQLVDQAQAAALAASQRGGGTVQIYVETLVKDFRNQLKLETDLRSAVASGAFQIFYQPQVEVLSGQITGMEALLRWPHEEHGFVSPAEFVPIGERLGLMDEIGAWVLEHALIDYGRWRQAGLAPRELAINVSPLQLRKQTFVNLVQQHLARAGIAPECLVLEITESAAIERQAAIGSCLESLGGLGVSLAIDDFGTGYANLSSLARFPFSKLKIDRSMIPQPHDMRAKTLLHNVVSMGSELGLTLVAEGVESPTELAAVFAAGCRIVQGYFYSPPVSAEHLDKLLLTQFVDQAGTKLAAGPAA